MLPGVLVTLLKEIFKGIVIITAITGCFALLAAMLKGFTNNEEIVRSILRIGGKVLIGVGSAFIIYIIVTTVGPHLQPWYYFDKLSDPTIYQNPPLDEGTKETIKKGVKKGAMVIPMVLPVLKTGLIGFGKFIGIEVM